MPESFGQFFSQQPFWAIVIIIFMGLPILGAVAWVIMHAFKPRDNNDQISSGDSSPK